MLTCRKWNLILLVIVGLAASCQSTLRADDAGGEKLAPLLKRVDAAIAKIKARELSSVKDTPWTVMHAVIAFEQDLQVVDVEAERKINAIDYLCRHAKYEGKRIFRDSGGRPALPTRGLRFGLRKSFQVQDHVDQFLMTFADADVSLETPIVAEGGKRFIVGDMLAATKAGMRDNQEVGWTLVVTAKYLSLDEKWKADNGKTYRIEDVVALAIQRDPRRETEGGPHHLYGVAFALDKHRRRHGKAKAGTWAEARAYLDKYVGLAKQFQLDDGSFSAAMFRNSRRAGSPRQMVWATGHTVEWLAMALDAKQLKDEWVVRGVTALVETIEKHPVTALSNGGMYHAAHALRRYKEKVAP